MTEAPDAPARRISGLTVRIHRDGCIGTGACVNAAPEVFQIDERGIVDFTEAPPDIERERLIDACEFCPVGALEAV